MTADDLTKGFHWSIIIVVKSGAGLGSDAYVSLKIGATLLLARTPADARPDEDQLVGVQLNTSKLHLFDPVSEASMLNHN